jgi:hypothetical protein
MGDPHRTLVLALGREVLPKRRVYLDLKYWIYLRDADIGRPQNPAHQELLARLSRGVAEGELICPLEITVIQELMKQGDPERRLATARVMDNLSGGVCLAPMRERMMAEVLRFLRSRGGEGGDLHEAREMIWTKVAFAAGAVRPFVPGLNEDQLASLDAQFTQAMWGMSLEYMLRNLDASVPFPRLRTDRIAQWVNAGNAAHAGELQSLRTTYEAELRGVFDLHSDLLKEAMLHLFVQSTGAKPSTADQSGDERLPDLPLFFWNACRLKRLGPELPSFHILAMLYARVRWDRDRRFKANDVEDFFHAAAALPYCNVLLTEHSLSTLLTSGTPSLATEFGASVAAKERDALRILGPARA